MNDRRMLKCILFVVIIALLHSLYLNYKLFEVAREVKFARDYASSAEDYASEAADHARNAAEYASEAAENAFANYCSYCP